MSTQHNNIIYYKTRHVFVNNHPKLIIDRWSIVVCNFVRKMIIIPFFYCYCVHFPTAYVCIRQNKRELLLFVVGCVQPYRFFYFWLSAVCNSVLSMFRSFSTVFNLFIRRKTSICLISKLSAVITVWKPTITFSYEKNEPGQFSNESEDDGKSKGIREIWWEKKNCIENWILLNDVLMMSTLTHTKC